MGKTSFKKEKYQDQIRDEVNVILRSKISDPRLHFASVSKVELTADASIAKLYWDTFDLEKKMVVALAIESASRKIRALLAHTLKVRAVPELVFVYDAQYEEELKITNLLKSEKKSD